MIGRHDAQGAGPRFDRRACRRHGARVESRSNAIVEEAALKQTRRSVVTDREAPLSAALPPLLDAALGRLAAAVTRLKTAGERQAAQEHRAGGEDAFAPFQDDQARLDLEMALARVARLGQAQAAALERLGRAEASVEAVLRSLADEEDVEEPPVEEVS